jgi:hypothetical protein|tara:strand:+ start:265 stop:636 length:372 start_codon:yes stop_codon:yes gene_type:complete
MSKKSRKRNKKILAALALAGGAAMLGRGKGEISSNRPSGIDTAMKAKDYISKKADVVSPGSSFKPRVYPGTVLNERGPKIINPNEDNPYVRIPPGGMRTFKKGGRVTGIAKRGFGRALMKGKK